MSDQVPETRDGPECFEGHRFGNASDWLREAYADVDFVLSQVGESAEGKLARLISGSHDAR